MTFVGSSIADDCPDGLDASGSVGYSTAATAGSGPTAGWCAACYASGAYTQAITPVSMVCRTHAQNPAWRPSERHQVGQVDSCEAGSLRSQGQSSRQVRQARRRSRRAATVEPARRSWGELSAAGRRICQAEAERPTGWVVPEIARQRLMLATAPGMGRQVVSDPREILARFDACEDPYGWYRSRWWRTRAIIWALASLIDWEQHVIQATGARIATVATEVLASWAASGQAVEGRGAPSQIRQHVVSERSTYDALAWLEEAGILVCLLRGVSAEGLQAEVGRAGIYAVLTPEPESPDEAATVETTSPATCNDASITPISRPPSLGGPSSEYSFELDGGFLFASGRGSVDSTDYERNDEATTSPQRQKKDSLWDRRVPRSTSARTKTVGQLRGVTGWQIPHGRLRGVLGMWFDAGWCARALMYALDATPDGVAHTMPIASARRPVAVLASRLKYWIAPETGLPMAPPVAGVPAGYRADRRRQPQVREAPGQYVPRREDATAEGLRRGAAAEEAMAALKAKLAAANHRKLATLAFEGLQFG